MGVFANDCQRVDARGGRISARPRASAILLMLFLLFSAEEQGAPRDITFHNSRGANMKTAPENYHLRLLSCEAAERNLTSQPGEAGNVDEHRVVVPPGLAPHTLNFPNGGTIRLVIEPSTVSFHPKPTPVWKRVAGAAGGVILATLLTFCIVDLYSAIKRRLAKKRARKRLKEEDLDDFNFDAGLYNASEDESSGEESHDKSSADPQRVLEELMLERANDRSSA